MRLHRRRLQTRWICATAVPWVLAGGLLVSFTAAAGNDPRAGVSAALRTTTGELLSHTLLVPLLGMARDAGAGTEPEELPLRSAAKKVPTPAPEVLRSLKGDPAVDLAPSLSRRARSVAVRAASRVVFTNNDRILPPTILMPGQSFRLPFSVASENRFECSAHSSGQMLVVVEPEPVWPWQKIRWRVRHWLNS